jgi:hypothetical protein
VLFLPIPATGAVISSFLTTLKRASASYTPIDGTYKFAKVTADMLGQKVKMYLKTNTSSVTNVYAVVTSSDNKVVTSAMASFKE